MQSSITHTTAIFTACAFSLALIMPLAAVAQEDPDAAPAPVDAAGVGVARVSLIDGSLSIQRGDASDALAAARNAPILGGDYVVSGDDARAEIQLDGYAAVRVDSDVQMRFTHLDPTSRSVQLAAGTIELRLLHGTDGSTEVDTPSITVEPQSAGIYRVTVTPDGQTLVTVRSGDARVTTPQGDTDLRPGSTLSATGDAANPSTQLEAAVAYDAFDTFNRERDRAYIAAQADAGYVDPEIGGLEDLSADGRWVVDGQYGHVWVPASVGADWAPYRNGRWVWEEGYGWTWVGDETWAWAPYHYGSWYNSPAYGWCWYPPQPRVHVAWRPALVAFIGFGAGAGFALGVAGGTAFANIGWVPLAPFEPYHPWWGNRYGNGGTTVVNNVTNVTNVTNITNINVYANTRYNAVTSVSSEHFIAGNFAHNVPVAAPQFAQAHVFTAALPVMPTASNLHFTATATVAPVSVRHELMQQRFAGSRTVVTRTPFVTQRVVLAAATHAAVTPLHFKDAQTTPLAPAHAYNPAHADAPRADALSARTQTVRTPEIIDGSTLRSGDSVPRAPQYDSPHAPIHENTPAYETHAPPKHEYDPIPQHEYHAPPQAKYHAPALHEQVEAAPKKAGTPTAHETHKEAAPHEHDH